MNKFFLSFYFLLPTLVYALDSTRPIKCLRTGTTTGQVKEYACDEKMAGSTKTLYYACMFSDGSWKRGVWKTGSPPTFKPSMVCDLGVEYAVIKTGEDAIKGPLQWDKNTNNVVNSLVVSSRRIYESKFNLDTHQPKSNGYPTSIPKVCYKVHTASTQVSSSPITCGTPGTANHCKLINFNDPSNSNGVAYGDSARLKGPWWVYYPNPASSSFSVCWGGVLVSPEVEAEDYNHKRVSGVTTALAGKEEALYCEVASTYPEKGNLGYLCKKDGCSTASSAGCCRRVHQNVHNPSTSPGNPLIKWVRQKSNLSVAQNLLVNGSYWNGEVPYYPANYNSSTGEYMSSGGVSIPTTLWEDCTNVRLRKNPNVD